MNKTVFSAQFESLARWIVVLVFWLIIGSIAIGKAGIANYIELSHERDVLQQANIQLIAQNQLLEQDILRLSSSVKSQIHYLKESFGYVETGEFVFLFSKDPSK